MYIIYIWAIKIWYMFSTMDQLLCIWLCMTLLTFHQTRTPPWGTSSITTVTWVALRATSFSMCSLCRMVNDHVAKTCRFEMKMWVKTIIKYSKEFSVLWVCESVHGVTCVRMSVCVRKPHSDLMINVSSSLLWLLSL